MMNNELKAFFAEFENNGRMPDKNTAKGADIAPEIRLENLSETAKTLAVIMHDLDVPFGVLCHWVVWNIPVGNVILPVLPSGAVCGRAYGKNRYAGPNIPFFLRNTHRYVFAVYALDCELDLSEKAGEKQLLNAMQGHILQKAEITGLYSNC